MTIVTYSAMVHTALKAAERLASEERIEAEITATIGETLFDHLDGPGVRLCAEDTHYAFSPPLEEFILPNEEKIVAKAKWLAAY